MFSSKHAESCFLPSALNRVFFRALDSKKTKADKCLCSTSQISPFSCCLSVVLLLDKGDNPENVHVLL